jgi:transketolase
MLYEAMSTDSRIFLLTADLGYGILDDIRRDFPDRAVNVGSCEQLMIGTAVGLANSGYVPVCYSITPFLLYRPFEMIRNYVNYEKLNVKLVGSGRDKDYSHDGITHWAEDDLTIMKCLSNISLFKPKELTDEVFNTFLFSDKPTYLNISRF